MSQLKPSLPSIQFLLQQTSPQDKPYTPRHRKQSHSISSLPVDLQNLSLNQVNGPPPPSPPPSLPSPSSLQSLPLLQTPPSASILPKPLNTTANGLLAPGPSGSARRTHGRSLSEVTMPSSLSSLTPTSPGYKGFYPTHRRAGSATNVDDYMHHHHHQQQGSFGPDHDFLLPTYRPFNPSVADPPSPHSQPPLFMLPSSPPRMSYHGSEEHSHDEDGTNNSLNRYTCPYCQKAFSRPSSLRIHTYSHTGEKPFACPEEGCGRRFSVQSNMRRHQRVHSKARSPNRYAKQL
ncbi:uncharacterized protein BYT42DRAFT_545006 [Radiomyces spectabilis]|uniref:uncharacterized protein n=1 Tax=Radiomyces spectabilis TaxID=64574 RepID=UPI002220BFD8|nr:uncharacterized protein BYT42DRAFT_545006 [Radiomyces spectabilis]KAI8381052.1 hypothetical protein BYT42DRAFT_545006 [Radiomyces spectabilis]